MVAHFGAKYASIERPGGIWLNYVTDFLIDCIQHDCNPKNY
jgi:hypothetical protein